jgi:hypothetical protein
MGASLRTRAVLRAEDGCRALLPLVLARSSNLRSLVTDALAKPPATPLPQLRHLCCRGNRSLDDKILIAFLKLTPALETLDIGDCPQLTEAALRQLPATLTTLSAGLTGRGKGKLGQVLLAVQSSKCLRIAALYLRCHLSTAAQLMRWAVSLRVLHLLHATVDTEHLALALPKLRALRELSLNATHDATGAHVAQDPALRAALRGLELRSLDLAGARLSLMLQLHRELPPSLVALGLASTGIAEFYLGEVLAGLPRLEELELCDNIQLSDLLWDHPALAGAQLSLRRIGIAQTQLSRCSLGRVDVRRNGVPIVLPLQF